MADFKESRQIKIENRVITSADLRKLANKLRSEFEECDPSSGYANISFTVACDDLSVFESTDPDIFLDDSVLSTKRAKKVSMSLYSIKPLRNIQIELEHTNSSRYSANYIAVKGTDSNWVNGSLKLFDETIQSFKPQNNLIYKYRSYITSLFAFSIGSIYSPYVLKLYASVNPSKLSENHHCIICDMLKGYPFTRYILLYLIYFIFGIPFASYLTENLIALWPSIELQVGPEHKLIEMKRRQWVSAAVLVGVLPMIVQLVYDIIKYFATK